MNYPFNLLDMKQDYGRRSKEYDPIYPEKADLTPTTNSNIKE